MRGRNEPKSGVPSAWAPADPNVAEAPTATAPVTELASGREDPARSAPGEQSATEWLPAGLPGRTARGNRAAAVDPELQARRRQAVTAFFTEAGGRSTAQRFGAEARDTFELRSASGEIDGSNESLLGVAGELAAQRKLLAPPRTGWRGAVTRALSEEGACSATASLLAKRAAGTLGEPDRRDLEAHLADCLTCRAAEVRWERAERAFRVSLQFGAAAVPARTGTGAVGAAAAGAGAGAGAAAVGASAAGATAAGIAASPFATAAPSAQAPLAADPHERRQRRRLSGLPLVAAVALAVAGIAAAAIIGLGAGSSPKHPVQAASPSVNSAQPAGGSHKAAHRAARAHAKPLVHHRARPHQRAKAATPAPVTASVAPSSSSVAVTPVASTPTPAPAPTPVTPSPPPPASSGSSGGTPSATIQQPSLGGTSAPTQTISPKH